MSIPSGYEKLAIIGIAYKNDYEPGKEYSLLNAVYYNGSTYVALKDNPAGPPVDDKVNWQYLAKGFVEGVMSAINVTDTSGVVGTAGEVANAQVFMDAMADRMLTKLLEKSKIVSTFLSADPTTVLSGALGPIIDQGLTKNANDITTLNGELKHGISDDFNVISEPNYILYFCVRNAVCYCSLHITLTTTGSHIDFRDGFPRALVGVYTEIKTETGESLGLIYIDGDSTSAFINSHVLGAGYCDFAYPIKNI